MLIGLAVLGAGVVVADAATEWTLHKTANGTHPSPEEQEMLWLMNEARVDPDAEGEWLASSPDPDVVSARSGASPGAIRAAFDALSPEPPAAFDARLWVASQAHNDNMIDRGCVFSHDGQFTEVDASGFVTGFGGQGFSSRVSIAFGGSPTNRHAALNIDQGFNPAGHRHAIMSTDGDYNNVGLALTTNLRGCFFPWLFSGAYAYASGSSPNHFNRFLVGTVWSDDNQNGRFDAGEGYPGVRVELLPGDYYAVTSAGGGFAVPATTSGSTTASFSGGGVAAASATLVFGAESKLLDYVVNVPEPGEAAVGLALLLGLVALGKRQGTTGRWDPTRPRPRARR